MPIFIPSPAGRLEALLRPAPSDHPTWAAIVCHPHPLYGGTMHNKVVFHTDKVLNAQGLPTLRFNFRGVGLSSGAYDHGRGEADDVVAAIDHMSALYPHARLLVAGFSFGAWVGLRAGCQDARVQAGIGLGLPFSTFDIGFLQRCAKPKLFIHGTEDEFSAMADVERIYSTIADPKNLAWIFGANHFFDGKFSALTHALTEFLQSSVLSMK